MEEGRKEIRKKKDGKRNGEILGTDGVSKSSWKADRDIFF